MNESIRPLTTGDVVRMAREQAEARVPLHHDFDPGTTQAVAYERAYHERERQLLQDQED